MKDIELIFLCGGFLIGVLTQHPACQLSQRWRTIELASEARSRVRQLFSPASPGEFARRYVATLAVLFRWLGARCLRLSVQLVLVTAAYLCILTAASCANPLGWNGFPSSDWTFSLSAMFGALLKSQAANV